MLNQTNMEIKLYIFKVTETRKGRVTVFFCGPPQLGKVLKLKCDQFGFDYRKENF